MMRSLPHPCRGSLLGVLCLLGLLDATPAAAQFSYQVLGRLTTGVTSDPIPGEPGDIAPDSFTELRPALRLGMQSGMAIHHLEYAFSTTIYARNFDAASSYANALVWTTLAEPSERLRIGLGAGLTQGQQNARTGLAETIVRPPGSVRFVELGANEGLEWQTTPRWSLSQTLEGRYYRELPEQQRAPRPDAVTLRPSVGVRHQFELFSLGLRLIGTYSANLAYVDAFGRPNERCILRRAGFECPTDHLQAFEARAESAIDLSESLSLQLEAGLLEASESVAWGQVYLQPTALIALRYEGPRLTASLSYAHTFEPALTGHDFRIERVRLEGRLPLGALFHETWFITAAAGYDFAQEILLAQYERGDSAHIYLVEAGLEWRINPILSALARYELSGQTALGPMAGFDRHAVLVGVEVRYPGEHQPQVRVRPGAVSPHQIDQQRWQQLFAPAPGHAPTTTPDPHRVQ